MQCGLEAYRKNSKIWDTSWSALFADTYLSQYIEFVRYCILGTAYKRWSPSLSFCCLLLRWFKKGPSSLVAVSFPDSRKVSPLLLLFPNGTQLYWQSFPVVHNDPSWDLNSLVSAPLLRLLKPFDQNAFLSEKWYAKASFNLSAQKYGKSYCSRHGIGILRLKKIIAETGEVSFLNIRSLKAVVRALLGTHVRCQVLHR